MHTRAKAFSLMEILVGSIILVSIFGGITATFISSKRYVGRANRRLVAINLVRDVLSNLHIAVRADTWDTGDLRIHDGPVPSVSDVQLDNFSYNNNTYNVAVADCDGQLCDYRQVDVRINYQTNP